MVRDSEHKFFSKKVIIISVFLILLALSSISFFYLYYQGNYADYNQFPTLTSSDRILIFSPHPDDESLANSGLIERALETNATVLVVMMTNGDATPINVTEYTKNNNKTDFNGTIGDLRHFETLEAMKQLGLNQSDVIFLGYPDAGLTYLFEDYWDYNHLYRGSNSSNNFDHSPYNFSYELNAPYCGSNVDKNLEQIIRNYKPNMIFYPDDGDEHPDHWATSAFVRYAAIKTGYTGDTYSYLVHKGSWPSPLFYQPKLSLEAPSDILQLDGSWLMLNLTQNEENRKEKAINSHTTQISLMSNYLQSFVRVDEIFANYPIIDIVHVNNPDFAREGMPSSSFNDLKYDSKTSLLLPSTDLAGAGFVYDDNNAYLLLKTSGHINPDLVYDFHLRVYNGTDFKRIDIKVKDSNAEYELKANNSVQSKQKIEVQVYNDILEVKIPLKLFKGVSLLMMSTDIYDTKKVNQLDEMSWRVFKFPTEFYLKSLML